MADFKFAPDALKEKARKFLRLSQEQATRYKKRVEREVALIREEIKMLKEEKQHLKDKSKSGPQAAFDFKSSKEGSAKSDHAPANHKT